MRVFLHAARQDPGAIAPGRVDVIRVRVGTGQRIRVIRSILRREGVPAQLRIAGITALCQRL